MTIPAPDSQFTQIRQADIVNHPPHYTVGGYEAIDVIRAKLTTEEFRGYCKGNALKYIMRSNYKDHHDTDIEKARWYLRELNGNDSTG